MTRKGTVRTRTTALVLFRELGVYDMVNMLVSAVCWRKLSVLHKTPSNPGETYICGGGDGKVGPWALFAECGVGSHGKDDGR
jgi:hypothetical protein